MYYLLGLTEFRNVILTSHHTHLDVECFVLALGGSVRVRCESNNPLVSPQLCTLESFEEQTFDCTFLNCIVCLCLRYIIPFSIELIKFDLLVVYTLQSHAQTWYTFSR